MPWCCLEPGEGAYRATGKSNQPATARHIDAPGATQTPTNLRNAAYGSPAPFLRLATHPLPRPGRRNSTPNTGIARRRSIPSQFRRQNARQRYPSQTITKARLRTTCKRLGLQRRLALGPSRDTEQPTLRTDLPPPAHTASTTHLALAIPSPQPPSQYISFHSQLNQDKAYNNLALDKKSHMARINFRKRSAFDHFAQFPIFGLKANPNRRTTMLKAWLMGAAIIVGIFIIDGFSEDNVIKLLYLLSPGIGAFVSAYYAPRWKFLLGMSMLLPVIVSAIATNYISLWTTGKSITHNSDVDPVYALLGILTYSGVLCVIASVIGIIMSKIFHKE